MTKQNKNVTQSFKISLLEGDMGVYGIAVSGNFQYGISVILLERRGIAVISIHAEHGFSPFSATEFGEYYMI